MKKLFLLIPILTFSLFGCVQRNDPSTTSSSVDYQTTVSDKYSSVVKHFEERDSTVVSIHESADGSLTILVLSSYRLELYQGTIKGGDYQYSLLKYL